jgi:hypothetical protein
VATELPEEVEGAGQLQQGGHVAALALPAQRAAQVRVLRFQLVEHRLRVRKIGGPGRIARIHECEKVGGVPVARRGLLAACHQLLQREFADRLQHAVARLDRAGHGPHEVLLHQPRDEGQHVRLRVAHGHGFRRRQREAAGKDAQAAKDLLLLRAEEGVAPGDGVANGALPRRRIARALFQQGQAALQAVAQGRQGEGAGLARGQLDGEWQPVELAADLGHIGQRVVTGERGAGRARPLDEELDGRVGRQVVRRRRGRWRRHGQRFHRQRVFQAEPERGAAGRQHLQRGSRGEKRRNEFGHTGDEVLAVVEQKQELARAEVRSHLLRD